MRNILHGLLILLSINLYSQSCPDSFKIGDCVEVSYYDSLQVYFNCTGTVVAKKCAQFYRKGKIDQNNINFSGNFIDYYINGSIALKATITNDYLNGEAIYFYENGNIKSKGDYKQDNKTGEWTYYYSNGQKEKVINFVDTYPVIIEYYKKNGKQEVFNGNGKYNGEFKTFKNCEPFAIWGKVKDGKMEGKWTLYNSVFHFNIGNEYFENGQFVKGVSGDYTYNDNQKIFIDGYCANEDLHMDENKFGCPGDEGIFYFTYKGQCLLDSFYPEILDMFNTSNNQYIKNQWLIVGLTVNKFNELISVNIKSSINDEVAESIIYKSIISMKGFTSAKINGDNINFDLFFTIMIRNNQIIIPKEYFFRNL